ncbi:MAG: hypothetical protein ACREVE_07700 [Gammaproteobacteria bacterium]
MSIRYCAIGLVLGTTLFANGCEHIRDPWISEGEQVEGGRTRSAELDKALDERALNQADR